MDYERFNPCAAERIVRLLKWAETGCWCCSAVRGLLVGLLVGAEVALLVSGAFAGAVTLACVGTPGLVIFLWAARKMWAESYKVDEEHKP
jgi:hypothetical protein